MIKKLGITGLIVLLFASAVILFSAAFTVHQTQQALILRFGEAIRIVTNPGLHFKMPIADDAVYIDKRILDLDSESQEVIASEGNLHLYKPACGTLSHKTKHCEALQSTTKHYEVLRSTTK